MRNDAARREAARPGRTIGRPVHGVLVPPATPAYTLGLLRIAFGALMFFWSLEMGQSPYARFGVTGFYPHPPSDPLLWSIFKIYPSDSALLVGWRVLMASSVAPRPIRRLPRCRSRPFRHPFGHDVVGMKRDQHHPGGRGGVRFGGGGGGGGGVSPSKMLWATLPWPEYTYQYVWQTLLSQTTG